MTAAPDPSSRVIDDNGKITSRWYNYFQTITRLVRSFSTDDIAEEVGERASKTQPFSDATFIEFPDDKDYVFLSLGITGTITSVEAVCASGTCTVTVLINGTALGGDASSVTTAESIENHVSDNALTPDDNVTIQVSDTSSVEGLSVTLRGSRTLA